MREGFVRGCLILGLGLCSMAGLSEAAYRHRFSERLDELRVGVEAAHPWMIFRFDFLRFGQIAEGPNISLLEDVAEASLSRVRVRNRLVRDGVTNAYLSVWFSTLIGGEYRTSHAFLWSPRRGRFFTIYSDCSVKDCPGAN